MIEEKQSMAIATVAAKIYKIINNLVQIDKGYQCNFITNTQDQLLNLLPGIYTYLCPIFSLILIS